MIDYIVNKEKRTVVAMIKFDTNEQTFKDAEYIYDNLECALRHLKRYEYSSERYMSGCLKMTFPKYMSAKAKCNPEDEWDEEYGKQLARQRLVEKIKKYRSNSYKIIADLIEEIKDFIN